MDIVDTTPENPAAADVWREPQNAYIPTIGRPHMTTPVPADVSRESDAPKQAKTAKPLVRSQIYDAARAKAAKAARDKRSDEIRAYNRAYTQILNKAYRARDLAAQASPDASIRAARLSDETYVAARAAGKAASQAT